MHFEVIKTWKPQVARKLAVGHTKCPTASFLATGGFVILFHKIPWFFHDYSGFFKFHDFSMHGTVFSDFPDFHDFQSLWEPWRIGRDFPRPDLGRISAPSQFKNEQKLPKMVYIIPNFLAIHFGENYMNVWTKIAKLQMHELWACFHSHFYANFHELLQRTIKATNALHC